MKDYPYVKLSTELTYNDYSGEDIDYLKVSEEENDSFTILDYYNITNSIRIAPSSTGPLEILLTIQIMLTNPIVEGFLNELGADLLKYFRRKIKGMLR